MSFLFNSQRIPAFYILSSHLSFPTRTCPQILCVFSVLYLLVLWSSVRFLGLQQETPPPHSHRTVVGRASERPSLIHSPCSCLRWTKEKAPTMATTSLSEPCPLSDTSLSLPHHKQSRTGRWITIVVLEQSATLHKKQEKREGCYIKSLSRQVVPCYSLKHPVGSLFQTWSGDLLRFSHTRSTNPSQPQISIATFSHDRTFLWRAQIRLFQVHLLVALLAQGPYGCSWIPSISLKHIEGRVI